MIILKAVLFYIFILFSCYFTGYCFKCILKKEYTSSQITLLGFVIYLAITEFFLWPFVAFRLNKNICFILMTLITLIPTILGLYFFIKSRCNIFTKLKTNLKSFIKRENIVKIIAILFIILEIILTTVYYKYDDDDSFYVSNSTLFLSSENINEYDSSFGDSSLGTVPMYDFQIWETLISYWSYIFRIEPVILTHTFLIPILIIFTAFAFFILGKTLFKDNNKAYIFLIFIVLFTLFGGYSTHSFGSRILSRLWQGKTIYLAILLPTVCSMILDNYNKDKKLCSILMLICSIAAIAVNPTGMYIIGFEILFLTLAVSIYTRNFKFLLTIIPSALYILLFALMLYFRTSTYSSQIDAASHITFSQIIDIQKNFYANFSFIYLIIYAFSCFIIMKKGNTLQKILLVITPILIFIFILNPISGKFVAEKITKVSTFWRVYWLVPFQSAISATIILILDILKTKKIKYTFIVISSVIIILCGNWLIDENHGFMVVKNLEKLPEEAIEFGKIISESDVPTVVAKEGINTKLRQKYSNITVIFSRYQYVLDLILYRGNTEDAEKRILLQELIDGTSTEYSNLSSLLNEYNVFWIITDSKNLDLLSNLSENGYTVVNTINNCSLLKKN